VLSSAVLAAVYLGMALGRWPGLAVDRTGVALVGAIVLVASGTVATEAALAAIDLATLVILFALMVLSAQVAASGLFDVLAWRIAVARASPRTLLALVVAAGGGLAAALTNDVVVWAMTPVLVRALVARGRDPAPYVVALALAANAGSAATVIGNPQNLLIAQSADFGFWSFAAICAPPAAAALVVVFAGVAWTWRRELRAAAPPPTTPGPALTPPGLDRGHLLKAVVAGGALLGAFTLPVDRALASLAVAGILLVSRRLATRTMLGLVDWHLLLLFAGLFVVTDAFARAVADTLPTPALTGAPLTAVAVLGSNTIGNVPLVTLVLNLELVRTPAALYALALFSTLAGNLLLVGSVANIIAAERAATLGVRLGFAAFARAGVPVTAASLAVAWVWLAWVL